MRVRTLEHRVTQKFAALLHGDMPVSEFRQWLFSTPDVADVISIHIYVDLLDIEYGLSSATQDVTDTIQSVPALQPAQLIHSHVQAILCGLVNRTIPVLPACQQLAWWQDYGAPWIPMIFQQVVYELDTFPDPDTYSLWNEHALEAKLREFASVISSYEPRVFAEAARLLQTEYDHPCD